MPVFDREVVGEAFSVQGDTRDLRKDGDHRVERTPHRVVERDRDLVRRLPLRNVDRDLTANRELEHHSSSSPALPTIRNTRWVDAFTAYSLRSCRFHVTRGRPPTRPTSASPSITIID